MSTPTIAATQASRTADNISLTKPADWCQYMVTAALKFASDTDSAVTTYTNHDAARLYILRTLNWYEAHDEYEWPDFAGFDFSQAMRFRRALISDICIALERAGNIKVSPEGETSARRSKRAGSGCTSLALRKRQCKREDDNEENVETNAVPTVLHQQSLAENMMTLIKRTKIPVQNAALSGKDESNLADTIHDGLVAVWDGPKTSWGIISPELKRKTALWKGRHAQEEQGDSLDVVSIGDLSGDEREQREEMERGV